MPNRATPEQAADDLRIADLLDALGYESAEAQRAARDALVAARLTNERKQFIAATKRDRVEQALIATLVRCCGDGPCLRALHGDPRRVVIVTRPLCEVCEGGTSSGAARLMVDALQAAGRTHLLVIGGSPSAHTQLQRMVRGSGIELRLVEGTHAPEASQARAWADTADVIVIWGATILDHKVSAHFERPEHRAKTITIARRGIVALATGVRDHLAGTARR